MKILDITDDEHRNRERLQSIAGQSKSQSSTFKELKRNNETIAEYFPSTVLDGVGRLRQRTETTNSGAVDNRPAYPLTMCTLPSSLVLATNNDWRRPADDLEDELLACAVQVKGCIELQAKKGFGQ